MMFFRRLQLPEIDGLSARPGARVDRLGATELTLSRPRNLGSQGTPASRGVFRPASWIFGVLLWHFPVRNTLQIARVAARIIHGLLPLYCALLRRTAAVRAAVATNCIARRRLRCNMQQSQAGLPPSRCSHRDVMLPVTSQRVLLRYIPYTVLSSRRLLTLASRRAGMNALEWLS